MTAYGSECVIGDQPYDEVKYSMSRLRNVGYHAETTDFGMLRVMTATYSHVTSLPISPGGFVNQADVTRLVQKP